MTIATVNGMLVLANPCDTRAAAIAVGRTAVADTTAMHLYIPDHLRRQLRLEAVETREVVQADGSHKAAPYVGPVQVGFKNRSCFVGALVLGDRVVVGAIPMADMDLVIIPETQMLDVNPSSPHIATGIVTAAARRTA